MPLINFTCPLCDGCFSIWLGDMLDGMVITEKCPYCQKKVNLTTHDVIAESCVQVIGYDDIQK